MTKTRTAKDELGVRAVPDDPVQSIRVLPNGSTWQLDDLFDGRQLIVVGRSPAANWTIPGDDTISKHHCMLRLRDGRLAVQCIGAKNRTIVNGLPLTEKQGYQEIPPGTLLLLGDTKLLVCGRAGDEQEILIVPPLRKLYRRTVLVCKTMVQAAARLGMNRITLRRRLQEQENTGGSNGD